MSDSRTHISARLSVLEVAIGALKPVDPAHVIAQAAAQAEGEK